MDIKSLISFELPVLSLDDDGIKAMRLMNEYRVFHLPLVHRDNYLALVSEDDLLDWDTPEEPLSLAEFINFRPAVFEFMHPFEAMKIAKEFSLSLVPVVDKQNHFAGVVTVEGLFNYIADTNAVLEPGGIIVLEMEQRNYSLSEIARICESNDVSILCQFIKTKDESGMQYVTIKVNKTDVQALLATFERFNYSVVETFSIENHKEDLQSNYDMLMHYINI
jgi:predicted transcriptional regulator